jgi:hypothetical protein
MNNYLRTVTLGAFTWQNECRVTMLFDALRAIKGGWILLHFLLVTFCLNFPAVFIMSRLPPHELYGRLYGKEAGIMWGEVSPPPAAPLPASALYAGSRSSAPPLSGGALPPATPPDSHSGAETEKFDALALESGYGRQMLLPLLGIVFCATIVIQAAFYLCAAFCLGLSRMTSSPLPFRIRFSLAVFSSTLPVLASSLLGLFLPAVHIIVFYFIVIFFIFQRNSRHCLAVSSV